MNSSYKMTDKRERIGLFGGTFDPFHVGHLAIIDEVLNKRLVDSVFVLPTIVDYHRPGKDKWLSNEDKFEVMSSIISKSKNCNNIFLDLHEIRMKNSGKITEEQAKNWRFINTIERLESLFKNADVELFTILGTDSLKNLKTWHRWEEIVSKTKIIGIEGRNDEKIITDIPYISARIDEKYKNISSSALRKEYSSVKKYINDTLKQLDKQQEPMV